jgi:ribosomal protein S4
LLDVVASSGVVSSRSDARRLIEQRGVHVDGHVWENPLASMDDAGSSSIQIGRTRFFRLSGQAEPPASAETGLS